MIKKGHNVKHQTEIKTFGHERVMLTINTIKIVSMKHLASLGMDNQLGVMFEN